MFSSPIKLIFTVINITYMIWCLCFKWSKNTKTNVTKTRFYWILQIQVLAISVNEYTDLFLKCCLMVMSCGESCCLFPVKAPRGTTWGEGHLRWQEVCWSEVCLGVWSAISPAQTRYRLSPGMENRVYVSDAPKQKFWLQVAENRNLFEIVVLYNCINIRLFNLQRTPSWNFCWTNTAVYKFNVLIRNV